jgi:hypothetical protein
MLCLSVGLCIMAIFLLLNGLARNRATFGNSIRSQVRAYGWPLTYFAEYEQGYVSQAEWLPWEVRPRTRVVFWLGVTVDMFLGVSIVVACIIVAAFCGR